MGRRVVKLKESTKIAEWPDKVYPRLSTMKKREVVVKSSQRCYQTKKKKKRRRGKKNRDTPGRRT